ncbi:hypothetical protein GCM10027277_05750 [Pseudoduganella ginsengisoli]|uniref:DUF1700 domain-containing protein n=1 Tax=Pseudoduganella ginsengisoli TaxID=1462440 RepID=A0A6L6Q471_9BURK|nr:DUF1700 domain-containing protein [Pseudoduganella ginsengisoli]MTW04274.1 DUF1700 domain-containing protein [Pseudoduganella ginsengisoli]
MNKQAYLEALQKALAGLPPETVARTMAEYEQRFIDGMVAGRSEQDIAEELGEPRKIAMGLRASVHMAAYQQARSPANWARMAVSFVGLAVFNLFMVVPAIVFASLLTAVYACAFAFYLSGVAITASGLAGTNELVLDGPFREFVHFGDEERGAQTRVSIGQTGIEVFQDKDRHDEADSDDDDEHETASGRIMEKAERVANGTVKISTELDNESRVTQTAFGMGMVILGIMLCLLSLVVTKYTIAGIKRYIQMNFSLLRGR